VSKESLVLKNPRGWFAAGTEVQKAMNLLTDGAFKLFVYLCLNARRDTGRLEGSLTQLAANVKKRQHTVRLYLREMEKAGGSRSTVITSQFPVESWHDLIGSPTLADAVMERILSNSYRLGLAGETMRPVKKPLQASEKEEP